SPSILRRLLKRDPSGSFLCGGTDLVESSRQLVEKEIHGGNPTVPSNDEVSASVHRCLTRRAGDPSDPPTIAQFLGSGNWLISKVRVSRPDRAGDAIDLVSAMVNTPGFIEDAIFREDLVDGRASTRRIVFAEHVIKITGQ